MKKMFCLLAVGLLTVSAASAQNYNWGVGVRVGGETAGAAVKYSFDGTNAIEGILSAPWDGGFIATALYERHIPVISKDFNFYYGAGAHIGAWDRKFAFGIDGIIGLEYNIPTIPLALSIDYKPIFNIVEHTHFYLADIALGVKVTF